MRPRSTPHSLPQAHSGDPYFISSASSIGFFLEEGALDGEGKLTVPKALAINKIGHGAAVAADPPPPPLPPAAHHAPTTTGGTGGAQPAPTCQCPSSIRPPPLPPPSPAAMHELDPTFRAYSRSERVAAILRSLGYRRPLPVQSMYIFKVGAPDPAASSQPLGGARPQRRLHAAAEAVRLPAPRTPPHARSRCCGRGLPARCLPRSNPASAARWWPIRTRPSCTPSPCR